MLCNRKRYYVSYSLGITCVYQADKDDPWEYCWICIDGYDVENMLNNSGFDKVNLLFLIRVMVKSEMLC